MTGQSPETFASHVLAAARADRIIASPLHRAKDKNKVVSAP